MTTWLAQLGSMINAATLAVAPAGEAAHQAAGHAAAHAAKAIPVAGVAPDWVLLIPGLPMLGVLLVMACAILKVKNKLPAVLTLGCLGASFGLSVMLLMHMNAEGAPGAMVAKAFDWFHFAWGDQPGQQFIAPMAFYVDNLTVLWMLFVTGLGTVIALYSMEYMSHDVGAGYCRYFAAFNLFVFSMACLVMGENLLVLFLGWEGVGLCSYLLIGYFYKKPEAVAAAKKAFIVNRIGDLGLLMGILSTFTVFGTVQYPELFKLLAAGTDAAGRPLEHSWAVQVIPLLFAAGAFGKSAQLFFYVWLPDAMEGPTPVSALIHAATMVTAGVFLIARLMPMYTADPHLLALTVVAWAGAITAIWAATIEMAIFDIKRVMGYSTISQLGFMFAGLGLLTPTGAAYHTFTHAFFKATLFLGVGAVMHGFGGQLDLRRLSGVMWMRGFMLVGIAMLIGSINLAGVPFTAGYFSKDMILAQAFITPDKLIPGASILAWVLLITAGMTAYYTFRTFFRVYVGPKEFTPGDDPELVELGRHPKGMSLDEWHAKHGNGHGHGHGHGHADHGHGHGHGADHGHSARKDFDPTTEEFDPHPPGWAMKAAIALVMVLSIAAAGLYFVKGQPGGEHGGWVGSMIHSSSANFHSPEFGQPAEHMGTKAETGSFFGQDPHKIMYYVSAGVGLIGILIAAFLHGPKGLSGLFIGNRTRALTSRADALVPLLGPIVTVARNKWYVDEIYNATIRVPLLVLGHIFHAIDKLLVDGLVNLFGRTPRGMGSAAQNWQTGVLNSYAFGMAAGIGVIALLALFLMN
jgi:NADH-quinone oxidoreductase subunit L